MNSWMEFPQTYLNKIVLVLNFVHVWNTGTAQTQPFSLFSTHRPEREGGEREREICEGFYRVFKLWLGPVE